MSDLETIDLTEETETPDVRRAGFWWGIRGNALELGRVAERELAKMGELAPHKRVFISRQEWEQLTAS